MENATMDQILLVVLLVGLVLAPVLLFIFVCLNIMDSNKNKDGYNIYNSSLCVQCSAKEICDWRHTTMCDDCKHNCGMKSIKSSFVKR